MHKSTIPYAETGFFSPQLLDYLSGNPDLRSFYEFAPAAGSWKELVKQRQGNPVNREALALVLKEQYTSISCTTAEQESLRLIGLPDTYTVTTAHQPNLLGGPLYLIYKTISAIRLAASAQQQLREQGQPDAVVLPVFWMGSEDHDVDELSHIFLNGKKLSWEPQQQGAFGRMSTATLGPLLEEISSFAGTRPFAADLLLLLREAYLGHRTVAEATRYLLHSLFGATGLLVLDPDHPVLKRLFAPYMQAELESSMSWNLVEPVTARLGHLYPVTAPSKELNLFLLKDQFRERIERRGDDFIIPRTGEVFTRKDLLLLLHHHPEQFSPNVILRPLYQETILPDLAFVGGGSECSYWLELKALLQQPGSMMPMVVLRNSVLWIEEGMDRKWGKTGLPPAALFKPTEEIIQGYLLQQGESMVRLHSAYEGINDLFEGIKKTAVAIDATLEGAVEAEKSKQLKAVESVEQRINRALKKKHEEAVSSIRLLREKLFPAGQLQERTESFIPFYLKHGPSFITTLLDNLDPFDFHFTVLTES